MGVLRGITTPMRVGRKTKLKTGDGITRLLEGVPLPTLTHPTEAVPLKLL